MKINGISTLTTQQTGGKGVDEESEELRMQSHKTIAKYDGFLGHANERN